MLGLFLVSKLSLQLIRIHQSVIYMILNTSSCLLHVYISIGVTWLHLLGRSWEWFNREVSQDEGCFTVGLVDPGGESSQHIVYHHNAWNSVLLSVVMRATELRDTVSSSPPFCVASVGHERQLSCLQWQQPSLCSLSASAMGGSMVSTDVIIMPERQWRSLSWSGEEGWSKEVAFNVLRHKSQPSYGAWVSTKGSCDKGLVCKWWCWGTPWNTQKWCLAKVSSLEGMPFEERMAF